MTSFMTIPKTKNQSGTIHLLRHYDLKRFLTPNTPTFSFYRTVFFELTVFSSVFGFLASIDVIPDHPPISGHTQRTKTNQKLHHQNDHHGVCFSGIPLCLVELHLLRRTSFHSASFFSVVSWSEHRKEKYPMPISSATLRHFHFN